MWLVSVPETNSITKEEFMIGKICSSQQLTGTHYGTEFYRTLNKWCVCVCVCVCVGGGALLGIIIHVGYSETNKKKQSVVPEKAWTAYRCTKKSGIK